MKRRPTRIPALALLAILGAALPAAAVPTGRLEYRLTWNGIPAASAAIEVKRDDTRSTESYLVEARTRTSALVDFFYSLRGTVVSSFDAALSPLGFRFDREINDRPESTAIEFGGAEAFATGSHLRDRKRSVVEVGDDYVLDPVTAIFHALDQPLEPGRELVYDVFTGQSRYRVQLLVHGEETIEVGAGRFPALRVEPRVWKVGQGLEPRLRRATIWVSQGSPRLPLKVRSEVFVGAVNADLVRWTAG